MSPPLAKEFHPCKQPVPVQQTYETGQFNSETGFLQEPLDMNVRHILLVYLDCGKTHHLHRNYTVSLVIKSDRYFLSPFGFSGTRDQQTTQLADMNESQQARAAAEYTATIF